MIRFNKLGLDIITAGEEPNPSDQLEEVNSYTHVQSAPLDSEKIVHIDIGTAHSVAVTGTNIILLLVLLYQFTYFVSNFGTRYLYCQ